jgi:hypothetical protein
VLLRMKLEAAQASIISCAVVIVGQLNRARAATALEDGTLLLLKDTKTISRDELRVHTWGDNESMEFWLAGSV